MKELVFCVCVLFTDALSFIGGYLLRVAEERQDGEDRG